jgi:hypothetical protein
VIRHFKKLQARFYETSTGLRPVRKWLLEMPEGDRRIVGKDIQKVEFGWPIGMPYCRPLGNGLWEVRSSDWRQDRAGDLLHSRGGNGSSACVCEEDAKNAEP